MATERATKRLKEVIDSEGASLSIAGELMEITSTVFRGSDLQLKCNRFGTTLGGNSHIPFVRTVKKGIVIHLEDYEGEAVSIHF